MNSNGTHDTYDHLCTLLAAECRVAVAFSGGTDSTLLLAVAAQTLGVDNVLALTVASAFTPAHEVEDAAALAASLGVRWRRIEADVLADPAITANPPDRCYWCKQQLFGLLRAAASAEGFPVLLDGANADDVGDYRPGQRAARELGVRSPLLEAGMTKAAVRACSRALGLPTWGRPAAACLASRIPYGTALTADVLAQVGEAEAALRALGFCHVRVRHHGEVARVELPAAALSRLLEPAMRAQVAEALHALGFRYVAADLDGYRTGSLNPAPSPDAARRV